uniref:Putative frizzled n=1 Tax=Rhipicephalus microplus TaxID=6941 RepID=A0A6M2D886_RHIMP
MQPRRVPLAELIAVVALSQPTLGHSVSSRADEHHRCEPLTIPMCRSLQYNMTTTPNLIGQEQDEAGLEAHQFYPLVQIKCSPDLQTFICSVYAPECRPSQDYPIPPCRSLCASAREGCEPILMKFGFLWPEHFDCDKFPEVGPSELCVRGKATHPPVNETPQTPDI